METFNGVIKITGGTIKTWQELIIAAINARTYSADGATNTKLKSQMKDRFRGAYADIRRFRPSANIFTVDAYKGNSNGTISQAAWTLPDDVTVLSPGGASGYDGGIEYKRSHGVGLASEAVYAAADTTIEVEIQVR